MNIQKILTSKLINCSAVAKDLGIKRQTLHKKINKLEGQKINKDDEANLKLIFNELFN